MTIDDTIQRVKERREATQAKHATKAAAGEQTIDTFRILWNDACPEHQGAWGSTRDMKLMAEKLVALAETVDDIPAFLAWVSREWRSLKFRSGTAWMHEKHMLPRHPSMRFVLHHWTHVHASYVDREQEKGYNYVDPEVDLLREDIGFLEHKLREAAKFGQEAQIARLRARNKELEVENAQLRAQLCPFIDLDTDLPTWEEREDAKNGSNVPRTTRPTDSKRSSEDNGDKGERGPRH